MTQKQQEMGYTTNTYPAMTHDGISHSGWSHEEDALLFDEVKRAREEGRPLKSVFDLVSEKTGRKPNSIRNYYYVRVRDKEMAKLYLGDADQHYSPAFTPFTEDEVRDMLRLILHEQANGLSVRACTMKLGQNDNKAMLRFQNKYRSVLKNSPELVRDVIAELREKGIPAYDPYTDKPVRTQGRPKRRQKTGLVEIVSQTVEMLDSLHDIDVQAFFDGLKTLVQHAGQGLEAVARISDADGQDAIKLRSIVAENQDLRETVKRQVKELNEQRERFNKLSEMFDKLIDVNKNFLGLTSVVKVSSLNDYVTKLSDNVDDCERLRKI